MNCIHLYTHPSIKFLEPQLEEVIKLWNKTIGEEIIKRGSIRSSKEVAYHARLSHRNAFGPGRSWVGKTDRAKHDRDGIIHLNEKYNYSTSWSWKIWKTTIDPRFGFAHEIGHALGLSHTPRRSIMNEDFAYGGFKVSGRWDNKLHLTEMEINTIKSLWSA